MRRAFTIAAAISALGAAALAAAPAGYEKICDAPTRVNLGGRPVVADIEFHADKAAAKRGDLRLALITDVTKFVEETEADLENWLAAQSKTCGERWDSGAPRISFPDGAIRFEMYLEFEYWSCGWNGKGVPGRMAQETGSVDVTLIPYVENGRLQARLGGFTIKERTGVSKYLPLDFVISRALTRELNRLNDNPKFWRAPQPLLDEAFVYERIDAEVDGDDRVVITALYRARGAEPAFGRIIARLRTTGITQQQPQ